MAPAEVVENAKGMKDAEEAVYDRDDGIAIDGKDAIDMNDAGRVEQAKDVGYKRDVVRRGKLGRCDLTKTPGTLETSEKLENVAYDPIGAESTRITDLGSVGDAPTHTLQAMRTVRTMFYRPLTGHEEYEDSTDTVGDGTALTNVERANNAYDVAVDTMRPHELLK